MSKRVSVSMFSTGRVKIRPEHVGPTQLPTLVWLMTATKWTQPRPINVYVIKHPQGTIVFDTGQDIASVEDPRYFPKGIIGWLYSRLAKFDIGKAETFEQGLANSGVTPDQVKFAVISHLHQDHIGGLASFANRATQIVVHGDELRATKSPAALLDGYMQDHIFLEGLNFLQPKFAKLEKNQVPGFNRAWDVFGDGLALVLEVPGHTEGSLALLVNYGQQHPMLFVGDLTYDVNLLLQGKLPGVGSRAKMRASVNQVLTLSKATPNLLIAAAHDPGVLLPSVQ